MKRILFHLVIAASVLLIFESCSKEFRTYSSYSRKGSISEKDSAAFFFYRNGDYEKAAFLFEELQAAYRGSERAKTILYHYAYSKFYFGMNVVSAYYFEQYARLYPADPKTPECMYMVAESYYRESAPYYLDQTFTNKGINQYQLFINTYPYSDKVEVANERLRELRERLASKEFETAKLYFKVENFKAAVTSFEVMVSEFPDSRYREEAEFYLFRSAYELAEVSSERRKRNRYLDTIEHYERFVDRYPNSVYLKDAENLYLKAKRSLGKINAKQSSS